MTESYQAPDPCAAKDMADAAVALAFAKKGMRDQLMITRCSVNMDVFLDGDTPASLWGNGDKLFDDGFDGFTDIFPVSMENSFKVGRAIIEDVRENGF